MFEIYQASIGGKLKLKGADAAGVVKKKKKRSKEDKERLEEAVTRTLEESGDGAGESKQREAPNPPPVRKTKAELAFEEVQKKRQQERISKLVTKSHKDRVQEFNERLEKQTEHFDIPKVGPG
ncbi:DUF1754-domain-containing protein [Gonapodya prolifera JEL478]|uniref:DUF1754-domain-containing protein n=1 Tax=Gonapodya prolifera (strain JEL478) TaxID=1344416 RepID=A0A139ADM0_GONPJ|nr:DUF1754-domain-containing protein [Gonapodya prolifera JEL478]|eukprot:KXS14535.1 DUF1754-domain-containing protein [Gonapodya prolifera JEL478]